MYENPITWSTQSDMMNEDLTMEESGRVGKRDKKRVMSRVKL